MAWILDIAIVLIFVLAVWNGHRRGLIKTLTGVVAFAAAAVVALLLNTVVAGIIYDKAIEPPVVTAIEERLADGGSLQEGADKALEAMPGFVKNMLGNAGITSGQDMINKLTGGTNVESQAYQISDEVVRPLAMPLLRTLCTLLLFLVMLLVAHLVLRVLDIIAKLPLLKQLNKGLGGVAGVVSGILWVLFVTSVVQIVAAVSSPDFVINQTVLSETHVFQWLMNINPLAGTLQDLMVITGE